MKKVVNLTSQPPKSGQIDLYKNKAKSDEVKMAGLNPLSRVK